MKQFRLDDRTYIAAQYDVAIRADMAVREEYKSGFYDDYYDLNSDIVKGQANAHGEY